MRTYVMGFGLAVFCNSLALGAYSPGTRSINGTGEVLGKGRYELGLMETDYGIDDDWMIRAPSAALLVGYGKLELRRRYRLEEGQRVSPYIYAETPRRYGFGSDYGWDFGEDENHSVTIGLRAQFVPRLRGTTHGPRSRLHTLVLPNVEYDYYARGNDTYFGIAEYLPYLGHTWAFKTWHIGLILSPFASMIPLPYAYIRF